uniref:hypothetical protein n=1 Tax=Pseudomonas sp. EA_65y_Pfl1_P113 TaxID=3088692 RepID=UPI0030DC4EF0
MPTTEQCGITPDLLSSTVLMRMSGSTVTLKNYNPASLESRPSLQVWIKTILLPIGLCVSSVTLEVKDNGPYLDLHDRKTVYYINELMFQDDILISSTAKDHPEQIRKAVDQLTSDFRAALELERTPLTKP